MNFITVFQVVAPILSLASIIVFTIAYVWTQGKNGSNKANQDAAGVAGEVIGTYKEQVNQLKESIAVLRSELSAEKEASQKERNEMAKQIGELRGELNAKNEQIKVLQGRNPEIEETLRQLATSLTVLVDIKEYLAKLQEEGNPTKVIVGDQKSVRM